MMGVRVYTCVLACVRMRAYMHVCVHESGRERGERRREKATYNLPSHSVIHATTTAVSFPLFASMLFAYLRLHVPRHIVHEAEEPSVAPSPHGPHLKPRRRSSSGSSGSSLRLRSASRLE